MKICVYTIALNEQQFVNRWFDSVADADCWLVLDTGSTDQTVTQLVNLGVHVPVSHIRPWRFDWARNQALSMIPPDVDVCISMDMDEHMAPGWRQQLEQSWVEGTTRINYDYHTIHNGMVTSRYHANKIHSRWGYVWRRPVHETVFATGEELTTQGHNLLMLHEPDATKSRGQYLPLLELSHAENPDCSQTLFWLAREYGYQNQHDQAVHHFNKLLMMMHVWDAERSEAHVWLSKLLPHDRLRHLRMAVAVAPQRREPWLELAQYHYNQAEWLNCLTAATQALNIEQPMHCYLDDARSWQERGDDLAAIAAWNLNMRELSKHHAQRAVELNPTDHRLQNNLNVICQQMG